MMHIQYVRSGNEPSRNGFATVVNWTYGENRLSISVGLSPSDRIPLGFSE
jgi:hypothetical protein